MKRFAPLLILVPTVVFGCGPTPPPVSPPSKTAPADGPLDLAALASEQDPGEVEPLLAGMPAAVDGWFPARKLTGAALEAQTKQVIEHWNTAKGELRTDDFSQLLDVMQGLDMLLRHEQAGKCELDCWAAIEKIGTLIDLPEYRDKQSMIRQMLELWVRSAVPPVADEVISWLDKVLARVPLHRRRAVAHILRSAPKGEEATDVLRHLSMIIDAQQGRFDMSRRIAELVVKRTGDDVVLTDLLRAARACYRALDVAAGDEWLKRSRAHAERTADKETDFTFTERLQQQAKVVVDSAGASNLADRLARAEATYQLGRHGDAGKQYDQLHKAHPEDARPVVGQGLVAMAHYRMNEVRRLVGVARKLDNKDRAFYEVAIGTWFTVFMKTVLPEVLANPDRFGPVMGEHLPELRADVAGLMRYDPAMAELMAVVIDAGMKAIPMGARETADRKGPLRELLATVLGQALALRDKYPDQIHAQRLALAMAFFEHDAAKRKQVATMPTGAVVSDVSLQLLQRYVLLSAALLTGDLDLLDELVRQVAGIARAKDASYEARAFHADLYTLIARLRSSRDHWQRAEIMYEGLLKEVPADQRARLLNNIGVALFELGDKDHAVQAWQQAQQLGAKNKVTMLNIVNMSPERDLRVAALRKIRNVAEREEVKYQSKLWEIALTVSDPEEAKKQREQAHEQLLANAELGPPNDASTGGVFVRSLSFNVGYSTVDKLVVNIAVPSELWLLIPAPMEPIEADKSPAPDKP